MELKLHLCTTLFALCLAISAFNQDNAVETKSYYLLPRLWSVTQELETWQRRMARGDENGRHERAALSSRSSNSINKSNKKGRLTTSPSLPSRGNPNIHDRFCHITNPHNSPHCDPMNCAHHPDIKCIVEPQLWANLETYTCNDHGTLATHVAYFVCHGCVCSRNQPIGKALKSGKS